MENRPYTIWCRDFSIHETKQLTDIFQKSNCTVRKSSIAMTSLERHQRHQRHSKASTTRTSRTQTRRPRVTTSCRASSHHPPWRRAARARTKKKFRKEIFKNAKVPRLMTSPARWWSTAAMQRSASSSPRRPRLWTSSRKYFRRGQGTASKKFCEKRPGIWTGLSRFAQELQAEKAGNLWPNIQVSIIDVFM